MFPAESAETFNGVAANDGPQQAQGSNDPLARSSTQRRAPRRNVTFTVIQFANAPQPPVHGPSPLANPNPTAAAPLNASSTAGLGDDSDEDELFFGLNGRSQPAVSAKDLPADAGAAAAIALLCRDARAQNRPNCASPTARDQTEKDTGVGGVTAALKELKAATEACRSFSIPKPKSVVRRQNSRIQMYSPCVASPTGVVLAEAEAEKQQEREERRQVLQHLWQQHQHQLHQPPKAGDAEAPPQAADVVLNGKHVTLPAYLLHSQQQQLQGDPAAPGALDQQQQAAIGAARGAASSLRHATCFAVPPLAVPGAAGPGSGGSTPAAGTPHVMSPAPATQQQEAGAGPSRSSSICRTRSRRNCALDDPSLYGPARTSSHLQPPPQQQPALSCRRSASLHALRSLGEGDRGGGDREEAVALPALPVGPAMRGDALDELMALHSPRSSSLSSTPRAGSILTSTGTSLLAAAAAPAPAGVAAALRADSTSLARKSAPQVGGDELDSLSPLMAGGDRGRRALREHSRLADWAQQGHRVSNSSAGSASPMRPQAGGRGAGAAPMLGYDAAGGDDLVDMFNTGLMDSSSSDIMSTWSAGFGMDSRLGSSDGRTPLTSAVPPAAAVAHMSATFTSWRNTSSSTSGSVCSSTGASDGMFPSTRMGPRSSSHLSRQPVGHHA